MHINPCNFWSALIVSLALNPFCDASSQGLPDAPDRSQYLVVFDQARSASLQGDVESASRGYAQAVALAKKGSDVVATALVFNASGEIKEQAGDYQGALNLYENGLLVFSTYDTGSVSEDALGSLRRLGKVATSASGAPISTDIYRGDPGSA